ncbi:large-conductance mechanosensitive channel protein MscL [Clostridiales bacterium BX7]|uniref:Large-conductance mechanosensitive channel n=2 Tax=Feifania hominis TaxID=2763660 RepID=A0A926DCE1_9FIRM|nr:large-conductance mechanosensitive channel protein MscL [Feifania hominis]MBC8535239.1 large-conductance mechanosensitive channel protein MscL [Feifania hominis]
MGMKEKTSGFFGEFKAFISRGNVLDLAVGIIIGGAFTAIVNSLVNDMIMPLVGLIIGGINFSDLKIVLSPAVGETAEVAICYGAFLQQVLNFLIIAFVVFLLVKGVNSLHRKKEQAPPAPPAPSQELTVLTEIRDLLRENKA